MVLPYLQVYPRRVQAKGCAFFDLEVTDLLFQNEGDVNINVNIKINVNADGVFQSVVQGDNTISISDWNKQFEQ